MLIFIIVEGVNILMCNMMIFGQGVMCCYFYVLEEIKVVVIDDKDEVFKVFDKVVFGYIGFVVVNVVCSIWFILINGYFYQFLFKDSMVCYYQLFQGYSVNLVLLIDLLMGILGGLLKCCECLFVCLGDLLSYIYLVSVILKCFDEEGCQYEDLLLMYWVM